MSQQSDRGTIQDRHLDTMIQLAYLKDEEEEIHALLNSPDPILTPEEEKQANQIFQIAIEKAKQNDRKKKIIQFTSATKKIFPRIIQVAAAIILIIGIATPIALANSSFFRSKVMQLLINIDNEHEEAFFSFEEDTESAFYIPEVWNGQYFPSYIPKNFQVNYYNDYFHTIEFVADEDTRIVFSELSEGMSEMRGTENASVSTIYIRGSEATLIDGYHNNVHNVTVVWALDNNWFDLMTYGIDTSEALHIAESVRIIKK